jgi:hypothetical protein
MGSGSQVPMLLELLQILMSRHVIMQVNSQNKHGILLEVVQELMDMELTISKARITSDGGWFMDGEFRLLLN